MATSMKNAEEREVMLKQSLSRLHITGEEWRDYVGSESEVISHFVEKSIINKPEGEFDENDVIEDIITNHPDEYMAYLEELKDIYQSMDYLYP